MILITLNHLKGLKPMDITMKEAIATWNKIIDSRGGDNADWQQWFDIKELVDIAGHEYVLRALTDWPLYFEDRPNCDSLRKFAYWSADYSLRASDVYCRLYRQHKTIVDQCMETIYRSTIGEATEEELKKACQNAYMLSKKTALNYLNGMDPVVEYVAEKVSNAAVIDPAKAALWSIGDYTRDLADQKIKEYL